MTRKERKDRKRQRVAKILEGINAIVENELNKQKDCINLQSIYLSVDRYLQGLCHNNPQEAALVRQTGREWQERFAHYIMA